MENEGDKFRLYTRRALMLGGAQGLLTSVLVGRMYYLGVTQSSQYSMLAEDNRVSMRILPPTRGEIFDRNGLPLATNRKDFRVFLIPEQAKDIDATLQHFQLLHPLSQGELSRIRRQIRRQRSFLPVTVAENLSWQAFSRINVDSPHLPGIQPDAGETRFYPDGAIAAHVVGYVGPVQVEDRAEDKDPSLGIPGFKIGRGGLERALDDQLRGAAGNASEEVNAYGRVIRQLTRTDGEKGQGVGLTLDMDLQRYVFNRLGDESAAAVVMDVETGDLVAMASTPSYDSNDFNLGFSRENWDALNFDPRKPLLNKAIAGQYPPASTFKMIVALAALDAGVIDPRETIHCTGSHEFGDRTFYCWKGDGHGRLDLVDAIARSCDVYFYDIANRVGIEKIGDMARRLGLGEAYDIGIGGQQPGLVPTREWKQRTQGTSWKAGETLNVGIGQGAVLSTPLQLAVMTARLADGARAVMPRLIQSINGREVPREDFAPMALNDEHLAYVRRGMEMVTMPRGTAVMSRLRTRGVEMAGKTGTAQVRRITQAQRDEGLDSLDGRPWQERDHALFVAFAPTDKPRYALSVLVEHGGGGSSVAAPIARDIMEETLRLDPTGPATVAEKDDEDGRPG